MIITVQNVRQEGHEVVAVVLDGPVASERRFTGDEAETISAAWVRSQRDREKYAAMPPDFPTPAGIPVEL